MYEKVYAKHNVKKVVPKLIDVDIDDGFKVKATVFDTREVLVDLLTNDEVMDPKNLDFYDDSDPTKDHPLRENISVIGTSSVYRRAAKRLCKNQNDVLWPLGMYNDEINFDRNGKLQLDPWSLCFLRNKQQIRNQPWAWRIFGIVHGIDSTVFKKKLKPEKKLQIYHKVLEQIMKQIVAIQKEGGIPWKLKMRDGSLKEVNLIPYVQFIIGDTKGHDAICGRMGSHADGMKEAVRDCDVSYTDCDNINHDCKFRNISEFLSFTTKKQFNQHSFHKVVNAMYALEMGDEVHGVFGGTPAEILHVFFMGLIKYQCNHFLDSFSTSGLEIINEAVTNIIATTERQRGKSLVPEGLNTFRHGLSKVSLLTGKESYCRVFVMFLALSCSDCTKMLAECRAKNETKKPYKKHGIGQLIRWHLFLEHTLIFIEWLKQEDFEVDDLYNNDYLERWESALLSNDVDNLPVNDDDMVDGSPAQERVLQYMEEYYSLMHNREGNKCKIPKFHFIKHLIRNICRHGSPIVYDGSRQESNASTLAKCPGLRTQKHHKTISIQTACRYHEDLTVVEAQRLFYRQCLKLGGDTKDYSYFNKKNLYTNECDVVKDDLLSGSQFHFKIVKRPTLIHGRRQVSTKVEWMGKRSLERINDELLQCLARWLWIDFRGGCISTSSVCEGFTEYKRDDMTYRCHPSYRSESSWYDWVFIKWNTNANPVPAKIYMFFDLTKCSFITENERMEQMNIPILEHVMETGVENPDNNYIAQHKIWVVVHSADSSLLEPQLYPNDYHFKSKISYRVKMESKKFRVLPVESIVGPCFGMLNYSLPGRLDDGNTFDNTAIIIRSKDQWPNYFIE